MIRTITSAVIILGLVSSTAMAGIEKGKPESGKYQQEQIDLSGSGSSSVIKAEDPLSNLKSGLEDYGNAPFWNWVEQFGGTGQDWAQDVATDSDGNVYFTGHFAGAISIGDKNLICNGIHDAIVVKFSSDGELQWVTQFNTSPGDETSSFEILIGPDGSVYITGFYTGAVNIGGTVMPDINWMNLFVAKLNPEGQILMVGAHPSANNVEIGFDIDLDEQGNIYVLAALDNTITNFRSPSVLLKYSPAGDIIWEQQHDERFSALDVADAGLYLAGTVTSVNDGSMDGILDTNVSVKLPWGYNDAFIAKSDLDGVFLWATRVEHSDTLVGDSYSRHLFIDSPGAIYMSGSYRSEVLIGGDTLIPNLSNDDFIARCSPDGKFYWGATFDQTVIGIARDEGNLLLISEANYLRQLDTVNGTSNVVDTLTFNPRAISTFINDTVPAWNSRYAIGNFGANMIISKRDQNFEEDWYREFIGNSGSGEIHGMVADDIGNLYTYGETSGKVKYFGKNLQGGLFFSKQNSSGDLIWLKEIPGIFLSNSTNDLLAIDPSHQNIYFTGIFSDTIDIGGDVQLIPAGENGVFVAEYGTDGIFHWVYQGDFAASAPCLAADYSGYVFFSGTFRDSIMIGGTQLYSTGGDDVFITRIDSQGTPRWAKRAGGTEVEYMGLISVDDLDNLYLTGEFLSVDVTVDATPFTMNDGEGNILFSKLDKYGNVLWIDSKAAGIQLGGDGNCWPTGIATDPGGNSYIKGWHGDSVYFDTILLTAPHGIYNYFIAKFDADGNAIWANSIYENTWGFDYNQMDIDDKGSVYLGAQAKDTLWFGSDYVYSHFGSTDLFVAKYKTDGVLEWVKTIDGSNKNSNVASVAVSDSNRIYVGGDMNDYLGFGNIDLVSENRHGFVAMLTGAAFPGITFTKKDVTRKGGNDGSIDITVTGGIAPFIFDWSNGAVTEDIGTLVAGKYTVSVTDDLNNSISKTIQILEPLDTICYINPGFKYSATDLLVRFSNITTGVNNSYSWSFGDGYLSNLFEPEHIFTNAGVYGICLTVYDSITGCIEEICQNVHVGSMICYADFEFYHNADTQNLVHFKSAVGGPVESYYWRFGDGYGSTLPDPLHKYSSPGFYEVSLTVTDSTGNCMDEALESIRVGGDECNADFSYYTDLATNTAFFTSNNLNDNIVYYWIFGDGSQSSVKDPSHTFTYPGFYKISLSVYDAVSGCMDNKDKIIQVGQGEDVEADFMYQTQTSGTSVRFQDLSLGKDLTYLWDFGDGNTSTRPDPINNYITGGYYFVCLNVYSSSGLQNITCKSVFTGSDANQVCLARFAYMVDDATRKVTYIDKSFGSPDIYQWKFGDGGSADKPDAVHSYTESGYYTVQFTIQNSTTKCKDHEFKLVNVDEEGGLQAGFGYIIDESNKKADTYPVDFIGVSLGDAGKLKWDFGDGNIDTTSMNPTHNYAAPGTYEVCLILSDPNTNASDTVCQMISVGTTGIIDFALGDMGLMSYPNPFNEHSTIVFELQNKARVDLALYDLMGRKVQQLLREERETGRHQIDLDGTGLESGHYYLLLRTPDAIERTVITIAK